MNKCPYCGKEKIDMQVIRGAADILRKSCQIKGEMVNPGGRELITDRGSLQLSECCDNCDAVKILAFAGAK